MAKFKSDPERDAHQLGVIKAWGANKARGTLVAATGYGKGRCGPMAAHLLTTKYPVDPDPDWLAEVVVLVPSIPLQNDWNKNMKSWGIKDFKVLVINTAIKYDQISCRLLIADEIHSYAGPEFRKVFQTIKYKRILGLTATAPDPLTEFRAILDRIAPIIATVSLEECRQRGWVSDFTVYNLPVYLPEEEMAEYKRLSSEFNKSFAFFAGDLHLMFKSLRSESVARAQARRSGLSYGQILGIARKATASMRQRNAIVNGTSAKIDTAYEICTKFSDRKILTFAQDTSIVDTLHSMMPDSMAYHSKIKGGHIDEKRLSQKAMRQYILDSFAGGDVRVLHSAKALDQGVSVSSVDMAVIISGSSKQRQAIQRYGRSLRVGGKSSAIIVELYVPGTQDEKWVRSRQAQTPNTKWIDEISEIE